MRGRIGAGALLLLAARLAVAAGPAATSCITCHGDPSLFDEASLDLVRRYAGDVHAAAGLSCHDCHGGNPAPPAAADLAAAKDEGYAPSPYRGAPARQEIPAFCGRCHSDPDFMKRYRPDLRVDQEEEYRTSRHGEALARGDAEVATCVDCHGVHGILAAGNPASPVYPTQVAETCRRCHAEARRRAGRTLPDGRPVPLDPYARWRGSVHAEALLARGDLSAPTCNDCHGNHGAAPPGLDSVAFVCGQCHGREAELFRSSPKHDGFRDHNELLAGAGEKGCTACHADPEPPARLTGVRSFGECISCHGNHAIVRPSLAMLSPLPQAPCSFCHGEADGAAAAMDEPAGARRHYREVRDALLAEASARGLGGEARFDWLVDQAQALPPHTRAGAGGEGDPAALKPEFAELFRKFRIGKTTFPVAGPAGGEVRDRVRRCGDCHGAEPAFGEPVGYDTARTLTAHLGDLAARAARAERMLLRARRGGVATREAMHELERAVDAQIELEVLVHAFSTTAGSAFLKKSAEGLAHADAALASGRRALTELDVRRRGLAVSLVFIVGLLIGLAAKIRQLSRAPASGEPG